MINRKTIIFSYAPLFYAEPTTTADVNKMIKIWEELLIPKMYGCGWAKDDERGFAPIFIYDEAYAIYDHLVAWAENKPNEWFFFSSKEKNGGYEVFLCPNIKKSLLRHQQNHKILYNEDIKIDNAYVLFHPLGGHFSSAVTYRKVKIPKKKISVGFISTADFTNEKLDSTKWIDDIVINNSVTPHE